MMLTDHQMDALGELINLGYARAAGALSQLTGYRVMLEVPKVAVLPIDDTVSVLRRSVPGEATGVSQVFSGPISGHGLLILDRNAADLLAELLTDDEGYFGSLAPEPRDVMTEFGNIVLNACLGSFGNLLRVELRFSVPSLRVETVDGILHSTRVAGDPLSHALMVRARFHLQKTNVTGYLVIILGITSLDRLLLELERGGGGIVPHPVSRFFRTTGMCCE